MHLKLRQGDAPAELIKWTMMQRFGWTPKEYAGLTMAELHEYLQVEDGRIKARGK